MSKIIERFKNDYIEWGLASVSIILFGLHLFQFFDSGFIFDAGLRTVFYFIFALSLFFFGKKCVFWELLLFVLVDVQTISFENYTAFLILCLCFIMKQNRNQVVIPGLIVYALDVLVVCIRHDKSAVHFVIHGIVCACIFYLVQMFVFFIRLKKNLDLTEEERHILQEIVFSGKKLKEIDGYKQNTISKKLKRIRERNGYTDNESLYKAFSTESTNNPRGIHDYPYVRSITAEDDEVE